MRNKQKIVILGPRAPAIGGVATYIQNILQSSLTDHYKFIPVRTMSRKHGTESYNFESRSLKILRIFKDFFYLGYILCKIRPDLIHINTSFDIGAFHRDVLYLMLCKVFRKKIFLQIHGGNLNDFLKRHTYIPRKFILEILRWPDQIGVLSKKQKNPFSQFDLHKNVKIFPNSIQMAYYQTISISRESMGLPKYHTLVVFIASHFTKEKGVFELIQAIKLIVKKQKKVLFILIGGGHEKQAMETMIKENGIEPYIHFTGFIPKNKIGNILHVGDILVLPSYSEGFPYVILEAMSSGLAVVATPVGAIPEMIEDGLTGFIVPLKNVELLVKKISTLIYDRTLRRKMGQLNIDIVRQKYDLPIVMELINQNYKNILRTP